MYVLDYLREDYEPEGEVLNLKNSYCDAIQCKLREACLTYKETICGNMKPKRTVRLEANQRTSPWPSWMEMDENGVWRDTRITERQSDMEHESEMVSNDGGEVEDRDGEPGSREIPVNYYEGGIEEFLRVNQDIIESGPSVDESDNSEPPF